MTIDNIRLAISDTNSVNSTIEGSSMNIKHQVGAHEGYSTTVGPPTYASEDARGPPGPEFSTQQLRINTLVDGYSLYTDARPTNSVSTFTAYLSCINTNGEGNPSSDGVAFPRLQLSYNLLDTNVNYEFVVHIPASNTVSGVEYLANFMLPVTGTNLFLPQINVRDASLDAYFTSTGDPASYYGTVNATPIVIPEPSSLLLTGAAMAVLLGKRMKQGMKDLFSRKGKNKLEEKVD